MADVKLGKKNGPGAPDNWPSHAEAMARKERLLKMIYRDSVEKLAATGDPDAVTELTEL